MTVNELQKVFYDNVCLYQKSDEEYENLYKGNTATIPAKYLDCEIKHFGAKRKDWLDVCIIQK